MSQAVSMHQLVRFHGNMQVLHSWRNWPDVLESKGMRSSMQQSTREAERIHLMQTIIVPILINIVIQLRENNLITVAGNEKF